MTRKELQKILQGQDGQSEDDQLKKLAHTHPVVSYPDEPLRAVVYRMAESGFTRFPVVERDDPQKLLGIVSLGDLLKARTRNLEEERQRERVLHLRLLLPRRTRSISSVRK